MNLARIIAGLLVLLTPLAAQTLRETLDGAFRLQYQGKNAQARSIFERGLTQARAAGDRINEADAQRGLGLIANAEGRYQDGRVHFTVSMELFEAVKLDRGAAHAANGLATSEFFLGNRAGAKQAYLRSKEAFERAGIQAEVASAYYNLTFTASNFEEKLTYIEAGLALARKIGEKRMEGLLLHSWGDGFFTEGRYADADAKLEQAAALLEQIQAKNELARVLTSMGRVQRAHGAYEKARTFYLRSLDIQKETGDLDGQRQSLNSISSACVYLKQRCEGKYMEEALALARKLGSPFMLSAQLTRHATWTISQGNFQEALTLLDEAMRIVPAPDAETYERLAYAYRGLKRHPDALQASNRAVELSRGFQDVLRGTLLARARILAEMGRNQEALADIRDGMAVIERLRASSIPDDERRRGFAEQQAFFHDSSISLLHATGQDMEAMQAAEQARARAFLDLLASREFGNNATPERHSSEPVNVAIAHGNPANGLLKRGADAPAIQQHDRVRRTDRELRTMVAAEPLSLDQMRTLASRLHSTLLTYWITDEAAYIWVLNPQPEAKVQAVRIPLTRERLEQLVTATWSGLQSGSTSAGSGAKPVAVRGGDAIFLPSIRKDAWRELYRHLIAPVAHLLPAEEGSLLTIVPHGPLFKVSFAGLLDEKGRYLVEKYRVHYAPAGSVLNYTNKHKESVQGRAPSYLVVADPSGMPRTPEGKTLPALPGSRREASAIASLRRNQAVQVVVGANAKEGAVRELLRDQTVIHFATHGIVRDDMPFDSYLALGASGTGESEDGRLTAGELYQLDLNADLIVLSACRSGLGQVSMDGIVGLTRALFYAGAASILSTVWDVADEPTSRLMTDFYRAYGVSGDKSEALRTAQLRLLRALRSRQVKVSTPAGDVVLPEHPLFWAGFTLSGEPR